MSLPTKFIQTSNSAAAPSLFHQIGKPRKPMSGKFSIVQRGTFAAGRTQLQNVHNGSKPNLSNDTCGNAGNSPPAGNKESVSLQTAQWQTSMTRKVSGRRVSPLLLVRGISLPRQRTNIHKAKRTQTSGRVIQTKWARRLTRCGVRPAIGTSQEGGSVRAGHRSSTSNRNLPKGRIRESWRQHKAIRTWPKAGPVRAEYRCAFATERCIICTAPLIFPSAPGAK